MLSKNWDSPAFGILRLERDRGVANAEIPATGMSRQRYILAICWPEAFPTLIPWTTPASSSVPLNAQSPPLLGYPLARAVVEANQFLGPQCSHGVGASLVVTELNLGHGGREQFNDGSNLAAKKPLLGHILQHGDFGKKLHLTGTPSCREYRMTAQL